MTQVTFELPDDLMREIGPYQGRIQELILLTNLRRGPGEQYRRLALVKRA